jgi:hypothetical protein
LVGPTRKVSSGVFSINLFLVFFFLNKKYDVIYNRKNCFYIFNKFWVSIKRRIKFPYPYGVQFFYYYYLKGLKYNFIFVYIKENVRFTTPIQQLYNNPSHEGESHILGPTLM